MNHIAETSRGLTIATCFAAGGFLVYKLWSKQAATEVGTERKAVVITGCDSGLGYSFTQHCSRRGITVLACVFNLSSEGAQELASSDNVHVFQLDVRDEKVVQRVAQQIANTVKENRYDLVGVVNNAGVLVFGEFECLSLSHVKEQIDVNVLGPMKFTKELLPLIREHKARIINVTSHCSKSALPSLSVYSATKAALNSWSCSLRIEMERFGVKVITFTPGSYVTQSRIMSRQGEMMLEMERLMSPEVKEAYPHFPVLRSYLSGVGASAQDTKGYIHDPVLFAKFENALLSSSPKRAYINEPFRYKFYHWLFRISPTEGIKEFFIKKFVSLPTYK